MDQRHPETGRPTLRNHHDSISTEETNSVEYGWEGFNIPTIVGGRRVSDDEAFDLMMQGRNRPVGMFESLDDAVSAARRRSEGLGRGFSNGGSVDDRQADQDRRRIFLIPL